MSLRDLPGWARLVAAVFLLIAGWFASSSDMMTTVLGQRAVLVSTAVVAISILLGMRLPLDLWPRAPAREQFSIPWAVGVAVVAGLLVLLAGPTGLPDQLFRTGWFGVAVSVIPGGIVWAIAVGRTKQTAYLRWFGIAAAAALAPALVGVTWIAALDGSVPRIDLVNVARAFGYLLVVGAAGSLVTQELAFRRLLVGQSGDAGMVSVLVSAAAFGAWASLSPLNDQSMMRFAEFATVGVVLGSLYMLSRSLLVPALYQGIHFAASTSMDFAAGTETTLSPRILPAAVITTSVIAVLFSFSVLRRSGFIGTFRLLPRVDAPSD